MNSTKVFLDINIGDQEQYKKQVEEYERGKKFVNKVGNSYGLGTNVNALDETGKETILQLYQTDPSSKDGNILLEEPNSLHAGRIVIELLTKDSPKACENFKALCTGELKNKSSNPAKYELYYKNCVIHRVQKDFMFQGGDFTRGDGSGGESIWNKKFNDDKGGLKLKHDAAGVVSMANSGKNSNTSQFFITFGPQPKLDGKYVVFGKVVEGKEVLDKINRTGTENGQPTQNISIKDCGSL
ncbi:hypothetical protein AKO1_004076 [Acrasis kona]|uniref:Peptidyl-prolyl cis-trans isomerase n=1 Tax=Acrasis kona TaxID=1008807 RepID=A0AAW2YV99_9EUKA